MLYRLSYQGKRLARNQSIRLEGVLACFSNLAFDDKEPCSIIVELVLLGLFDILLGNFLAAEHTELDFAITLRLRQLHPPGRGTVSVLRQHYQPQLAEK